MSLEGLDRVFRTARGETTYIIGSCTICLIEANQPYNDGLHLFAPMDRPIAVAKVVSSSKKAAFRQIGLAEISNCPDSGICGM